MPVEATASKYDVNPTHIVRLVNKLTSMVIHYEDISVQPKGISPQASEDEDIGYRDRKPKKSYACSPITKILSTEL